MSEPKQPTAVIVERGNYYMGRTVMNNDGEITEKKPPKWEADPEGCSVIVCAFDTAKSEPIGNADLFAAWDSVGIGNRVREKLALTRRNFPTPEEIYRWTKEWDERGIDFCKICEGPFNGYDCWECPIAAIKAETEDEND